MKKRRSMQKRILSCLLSIAMATSVFSVLPSNIKDIKAETATTKSTDTTYGSTTDPSGASDIKEWRDKTNEDDVWAGLVSFQRRRYQLAWD